MSRRRYISTEISVDRVVAQLSDFGALLYTWMIPHAEDDGTLTADPDEISWTVIPSRRRTSAQITEAINRMEGLGLVIVHEGRLYFPYESFYRYQTYIPPAKRRDSDPDSEERRETPQNTASPSPSPSPTPSPSPSPLTLTSKAPESGFAQFWEMYPRKKDKGHAEKAWNTAIKTTDAEVILAGLRRLLPSMKDEDQQYIKYPATWLNGKCWEDESPPEADPLLELILERNRHPRAVR